MTAPQSEEPQVGRLAAIRTPDQRLRVFISSTLGELAAERRAVSRAVSALRLTPVMFELGARPHAPQDLYRAYLEQSDVFIGLYWQRYGWVGPGMAVSGLEDEFNRSARIPRLLYIKTPAPEREPQLVELLARIRDGAEASYRSFSTPAELGRLVRDDLATLLSEQFAASHSPVPNAVPPSSSVPRRRGPLPAGPTSLVGRGPDISEIAALLEQRAVRLLTLTGPGGIGKTRLAVAVSERLGERFGTEFVFVPLAAVRDPALVLDAVARAVGADVGGGLPLEILAEWFGDDEWLLVLDNLEQVVSVAGELGELLARCHGLVILATSRTVLGLAAEREYPVLPLPFPARPAETPLAELESLPAVAMFVDRACAVHPGFGLTAANAHAVGDICRRLEGLPLAIELAAARTRLLDPPALLGRLGASLDALGTGAVDLPERQRTLRATVEWSVGLLGEDERSLLETAAVFVNGWTLRAITQVSELDEDRALGLSEALARHSLVQFDSADRLPRCAMLETVRAFVAERLAARPDIADVQRRHAHYYRALVEQADRPLRSGASQTEWLELMQAEARNLSAAVTWYLANDRGSLPHLFRALWPFWHLGDYQVEARPWVEELLPIAGSLDHQARAELAWAATVIANEVGDDAAALAGRQELGPLLEELQEPLLRSIGHLAMAWTSPITDDFEDALQEVSVSLEQLHSQEEPFWTALAAYTAAWLEMAMGRPDDAIKHVREMQDLQERFGFAWLTVATWGTMGALAVVQGRLDQAREPLFEALDLSVSTRSTRYVTLCLVGLAQLAFAEGDPKRAALLAGAAEGQRRRAGMRTWPVMRRGEAKLVDQVRQLLGADHFGHAFAEGSALSQQEAVAAAVGATR